MKPREFLMIPGPTPVPDAVLEAVARHPIGHRTADFSSSLMAATEGLKWLGQTESDPLILTASGTGALECAVANTVGAGDKVLSLICGVFGERWAKLCEAYGAQVERMNVEPGTAIDVEAVGKRVSKGDLHAVTITHNETSTGVINDLQALCRIATENGALTLVDAVTSFGACHIPIDKWGVDVLVTGSQKALMLPPGLSMVFPGKRAWDAAAKCKSPRFYFDFQKYKKSLAQKTTPFTPNVSLVAGLEVSLRLMKEEGLDGIFDRHCKLQASLRAGLKALELSLFVDDSVASPTITSILPPKDITVDAIRKKLKERFSILVADGQEELKGKIFRIGHMGYVFERDILMTLAALEAVLIELGHSCREGKAVEAAIAARK